MVPGVEEEKIYIMRQWDLFAVYCTRQHSRWSVLERWLTQIVGLLRLRGSIGCVLAHRKYEAGIASELWSIKYCESLQEGAHRAKSCVVLVRNSRCLSCILADSSDQVVSWNRWITSSSSSTASYSLTSAAIKNFYGWSWPKLYPIKYATSCTKMSISLRAGLAPSNYYNVH